MNDSHKITVLLVDDQPIVGEAIRRAVVTETDFSFHYCSNGAVALETATRIAPTVILQDLTMPGIDGMSLVRLYRENEATKDVPIIVLSAKEEPAIKVESFASGANDYLVKLPDRIELIARIRYHAKAFINQLQRDEAYRSLRESQALLIEKNLELERFSNVDGLTGISNRRYFDVFSMTQWKQAIRERQPFSILMIDVDNFKRYNDSYGHLAGDKVLIEVASSLRDNCRRPTDLMARFGGEEFIASLSTDSDGATTVAENLRAAVEAKAIANDDAVVTVSVGGASTEPATGDSLVQLIKSADEALYEAKHSGRNRVVVRPHVL